MYLKPSAQLFPPSTLPNPKNHPDKEADGEDGGDPHHRADGTIRLPLSFHTADSLPIDRAKNKPARVCRTGVFESVQGPGVHLLSPNRTTIGPWRLNCRVRDGNGCDPPGTDTETLY